MSFAQLADDTVAQIVISLDAKSTYRLILCGDRALSVKVARKMTIFEAFVPRFTKFPFSLFNFGNMRELSIEMDPRHTLYTVLLDGAIPLPLTPMPALTKLKLAFQQCLSIFRSSIPLESLFPCLSDLSLQNTSDVPQESDIDKLPRSLLRFSFSRISTRARVSDCLSWSLFFRLPPQLEHIELANCQLLDMDGATRDTSKPLFPPSLTSLYLQSSSTMMFLRRLPIGLRFLEVNDLKPLIAEATQKIMISSLPRTLEHLRIRPGSHIVMDYDMPPRLQTCDVPRASWETMSNSWKFPETLTNFEAGSVGQFRAPVHLLPNLTSLGALGFFDVCTAFHETLPSTLQNISANFSDQLVGILPDSIQSITMGEYFLSQLSVSSWRRLSNLALRNLALFSASFEDLESMQFLGGFKHLEHLSLTIYQFTPLELVEKNGNPGSARTYASLIALLPQQLIRLEIIVEAPDYEAEICKEGDFMRLTKLQTCKFISRLPLNIPLNCWRSLPPSLINLQMPLRKDIFDDDSALYSLPPKLESLCVLLPDTSKITHPGTQHIETLFSRLPNSLTSLEIDFSFNETKISTNLWNLLPLGVAFVRVGSHSSWMQNLFATTGEKYYSGPQWQDHYRRDLRP